MITHPFTVSVKASQAGKAELATFKMDVARKASYIGFKLEIRQKSRLCICRALMDS